LSSLVIPNVFANGTVINSSPFNQNFGNIVTWSTAIDNTNIGVAGIYASQIVPSSIAQATFGGTSNYTFPAGIIATAGTFSGVVTGAALAQTAANQFAVALTLVAGTVTFTFPRPYGNAPACFVSGSLNANVIRVTATTTQAVVTSSSGADTQGIYLLVIGNPN